MEKQHSETVILAAGVLLLGLLSYVVQPILSPFVITGSLLYLLYPLRKAPLARRLMVLALFLFALWFLYSILGLLTPFLLAFLIAYIVNPAVTVLEARRVPRWLSSLLTVVLIVATAVAIVLFVMPIVLQQFQGIINGVATIANDLAEILRSGALFGVLARYGIPVDKAQEVITQQVSPRLESVLKTILDAVFGFVSGLSSLILQLINIIIIPFLVFYLLKDFPLITHRFAMLVPRERRERAVELAGIADDLMGRYLRGAVIVAILQGTISAIMLWAIGVDFALVLGIMTGVLNFIPYVGLLTSLVVSSIVALFSGGAVGTKVLFVVVLYLSQKLLEATVLGPKIIGSHVGLHPVLLILCLLVFGYFLGFVGLLIAVPGTALLIAAVREWEHSRRETP
jgi:predicted PurR-regulated permease PerM